MSATEILAYYEGSQQISTTLGTGDFRPVIKTGVSADKPVLFTVSVDIRPSNVTTTGIVMIASWIGPSDTDYMYFKQLKVANGKRISETITFASKKMVIVYLDSPQARFNIQWHIMVQGSAGTIVTYR